VFSPLLRLKKEQELKWEKEHEEAFAQVKLALVNQIMIDSSDSRKIIEVICVRLKWVQCTIYYFSRMLIDAKTRYIYIEKLFLCLFYSCCKLKHYFET